MQMCLSENTGLTLPVEVEPPLTLERLRGEAAKKFKGRVTKKSRAYHGVSGVELAADGALAVGDFEGEAFVVWGGAKGWAGAARLRESCEQQLAAQACVEKRVDGAEELSEGAAREAADEKEEGGEKRGMSPPVCIAEDSEEGAAEEGVMAAEDEEHGVPDELYAGPTRSKKARWNAVRKQRAQVAAETMEIIQAEGYLTESGEVDLKADMASAIAQSVCHHSRPPLDAARCDVFDTHLEVFNMDSLMAAHQLLLNGCTTSCAVLNFASAKNPGGGFLNGASAQEEALCRASALYPCLTRFVDEYYEYHRRLGGADRFIYSARTIHSPGVPIFRLNDDLLEQPFKVSFITTAAPNAKEVRKHPKLRTNERRGSGRGRGGKGADTGTEAAVAAALQRRLYQVLSVAAHHGHDALVLGAFGCGAFGNNAHDVAWGFQRLLNSEFRGVFAHVVFAVLDNTRDQENIRSFQEVFGK